MQRIKELAEEVGQPDNSASLDEVLHSEIARRNFVRAVMLAQRLQRPQVEIRRLQELALKKMACEYRNAVGTRNLAQEWGFSRADLESLLLEALEAHDARTNKASSNQCYDTKTGKYLTLRQWIEQFLNARKGSRSFLK